MLPRYTLVDIVRTYKAVLETAIGTNISDVGDWFKPTTPTTSPGPAEPESKSWKWIAIGTGAGAVFVILILMIAFWW